MIEKDKLLELYRRRLIAALTHQPSIAEDYERYFRHLSEPLSFDYRADYKPVFLIAPDLQELRQPPSVLTNLQSKPEPDPAKPDSTR